MAYSNTEEVRFIAGNKRVVISNGTVNIVGDTYDTLLRKIDTVQVNAGGANAIGCTYSGGTITFAGTTGAVTVFVVGE